MGGPGGGGMGGAGGMGGGRGGAGVGEGEMAGGGQGVSRPEAAKATVRWESASVMRKAGKRTWPEDLSGMYVLSVSGLDRGRRGGTGGGQGAWGNRFQAGVAGGQPDMAARREAMAARLKDTTRLEIHGGPVLTPDKVVFENGDGGGMVLVFGFAKSVAIEPSQKEAIFSTQVGPMLVRAKFNLSEMQVNGKLDI